LVPLIALVGLGYVCVRLARQGHEDSAFVAAVATAVVGSPIVWMHYVVILLVAMAIKNPMFSYVWLAPIALWLAPTENPAGGVNFAIGFVLLVLLVFLALRGRRRRTVVITSPEELLEHRWGQRCVSS
jgi:hypothetical protein